MSSQSGTGARNDGTFIHFDAGHAVTLVRESGAWLIDHWDINIRYIVDAAKPDWTKDPLSGLPQGTKTDL